MASRRTLAHSEETRLRIKTALLVNALQDRALGKNKMDAVSVNAAKILLAKTVPDLKGIEHAGAVTVETHAVIYVPQKDGAEKS